MKKHNHTRALAFSTVAALLALTGCQSSDSKAEPSEATTPTAKPSEDPSPWAKKYTKKQLADYNAALQKWEEYEQRSEPYWAEGKATREAQDFFQDYWFNSDRIYKELKSNDDNDIQIKGTATVLESKPLRISKDGVSIKQCVDFTSSIGYQEGKRFPDPPQKPLSRIITVMKPHVDGGWLITSSDDTDSKVNEPCKARGL